MNSKRISLIGFLLLFAIFGLSGCFESDTENAVEDMGESIEETTEDAGDSMGDAMDDAGDAMDDAVDDAEDSMEN